MKLPYDLDLKDNMNLVVAFPRKMYRSIHGEIWGEFVKEFLSRIQKASGNSLKTPEALVESAYKSAATSADNDFTLGRVEHGYYFPQGRHRVTMEAQYELSQAVSVNDRRVLFEYPSKMTTPTGKTVTLQKTYFGRVNEIYPDGTVSILVNDSERKTFVIDKISTIESLIYTYGEMRYTLLEFLRVKGKSYLQWSLISPESKTLQTVPDPDKQNSSSEKLLTKFSGLAHLKGELVKVHYRQAGQQLTMVMKLQNYRYTAANDRLTLMGEDGITLAGLRNSFKLEKLTSPEELLVSERTYSFQRRSA